MATEKEPDPGFDDLLRRLARAPEVPVEGAELLHYRIVGKLGEGGMGSVWRAEDRRLGRRVAIKRLATHAATDETARRRLVREARAASALNHPGIVTIYAVEEHGGEAFIVMELVDGESLASILSRGPLPLDRVLALAAELGDALAAAHEAGLVHRDIKPANVLVTRRGHAKVLDFGVARLSPSAGLDTTGSALTSPGAVVGTLPYMAPDQLRGLDVDGRADVFALGCVLYEMATGQRAFPATDVLAIMHQVASEDPAPPSSIIRGLPAAFDALVLRALAKDRDRRFQSAADLLASLGVLGPPGSSSSAPRLAAAWTNESAAAAPAAAVSTRTASRASVGGRLLGGGWRSGAVLLAVAGLAAVLVWGERQRQRERALRATELPRLQALVATDECVEAEALALRLEARLPGDPQVAAAHAACAAAIQLASEPEGALVSYRPYDAAESALRPLGRTPLRDVRVADGVGVFRFEREGCATVQRVMRNPSAELGNLRDTNLKALLAGADFTVPLPPPASVPPGMVPVPATRLPLPPVVDDPVDLPAYFLGRTEVTNREYQEFVAAGGYRQEALWRDLPFGAAAGTWQQAVARFVDATGRPGPSTWEAGTFSDGAADHPVAGVSWFEATAYARFRGAELPTAYHWYRAAHSVLELMEGLSGAVALHGNYQGRGTLPVGQANTLGPYGTVDMAGNVREWLSSQRGPLRMVAGGSFSQGSYLYDDLDAADPWDRGAGNGLRLLRTASAEPVPAALQAPIPDTAPADFASLRAVDGGAWSLLSQQLSRFGGPLDARSEGTTPPTGGWRRESVSMATGYDTSRFAIHFFLPVAQPPPWQVVVFFPHGGYFSVPEQSANFDPAASNQHLDFLPRSGRVLAVIAFDGTFERSWSEARLASMPYAERFRLRQRHHREELGRALDYVQTRPDFASGRVGMIGISYGAQSMMPLLAVEPRVGPAVLIGGGVFRLPQLPEAEQPYNYLPHVVQPVLMLSGRWDIDVSPPAQEALLRLLGTPAADRKRIVFDVGHGWVPQNQFVQASLDWFDHHMGPVHEGRGGR